MDDYLKIIEARKHTYQAIIQCDSLEEIKLFLPKPYQSNFDSFLNGLNEFMKKEIASYKELYLECSENEEKQEIEENIKKLEEIILYANEYRSSFEKFDDNDISIDNSKKICIIFGTSPSGNNCFLGDLKKIDREYYSDIQDTLAFIENGINLNNPTKMRRLIDFQQKLLEAKNFKVRIYFIPLNNNRIYITMVRIKKDTKSLKDQTEPRNRLSLLDNDYERVKEGLKNPEIKSKIEAKAARDMEEVVAYINANKIVNGGGHHRK